ncbi:YacL family protein [Shewanella sp. WXL01]|uniref:YacL family protein n=1 Tax=Shewanella sp. WXL01 TaxID=2709721 RepID=UPI0014384877|nr:YacL family protein [Shewanella sp. WXL01]NKF51320.1 YacL family protein [Shewanella sp. WXL01]
MEYEFRRNRLEGTVFAEFSMEHVVLGRWFSEELGSDVALIKHVLAQVLLLQSGSLEHWRHVGGDLTIDLDREQVRVFANVMAQDEELELQESMSLYNAESESFCGLEDFEQVLLSWQAFIEQE